MDWKTEYYKNIISPQIDLQILYNSNRCFCGTCQDCSRPGNSQITLKEEQSMRVSSTDNKTYHKASVIKAEWHYGTKITNRQLEQKKRAWKQNLAYRGTYLCKRWQNSGERSCLQFQVDSFQMN